MTASCFVADLSFTDLQRLRAVVRKVYLKRMGSQFAVTDHECDKIIETFGPDTQEALIKTAVDKYGLR